MIVLFCFVLIFFPVSTKRSLEHWAGSGSVGGEQINRQASTSPVRSGLISMAAAASPPPASPSSSNASGRKKMVSPGFAIFNFNSVCSISFNFVVK